MIQTKQRSQKQPEQPEKTRTTSTSSARLHEQQPLGLASTQRNRIQLPLAPVLRFSPTAWGKLLYFRDHGETEIGGFAVTRPGDLL